MYNIILKKKAKKFIDRLPLNDKQRIVDALRLLPFTGDIKHLHGYDNYMRLRVGDYRIIYTVNNDILTVYILDAGNRGDIYNRY